MIPKLIFLYHFLWIQFASLIYYLALLPFFALRALRTGRWPLGMGYYLWARSFFRYFTKSEIVVGGAALPPRSTPVVYLTNHRTWADFMLTPTVTQGAFQIARSMTAIAVPFTIGVVAFVFREGIILFNRGKRGVANEVLRLVKRHLASGRSAALYLEGTRNIEDRIRPLKDGVLSKLYKERIPVFVYATSGQDELISEKKLHGSLRGRIGVHRHGFVEAAGYATYGEFKAAVQAALEGSYVGAKALRSSGDRSQPGVGSKMAPFPAQNGFSQSSAKPEASL